VAESRDSDIDTSVEWVAIAAAQAIHNQIPAQNLIRVRDEDFQKLVFGPGQTYFARIPVKDAVLRLELKGSEYIFPARVWCRVDRRPVAT
jgi:hypothetical protein